MAVKVKTSVKTRIAQWAQRLGEPFTTKDVIDACNVSRSTARKYVVELHAEGVLTGLPANRYEFYAEPSDEPEPEPEPPKPLTKKDRIRARAAEEVETDVPEDVRASILSAFASDKEHEAFRKRAEARKDRLLNRRKPKESVRRGGTVLGLNVDETVHIIFVLNTHNVDPSSDTVGQGLPMPDGTRQNRLDDFQLARWLCDEFPHNRRDYDSWLKNIPPLRAIYHRGKLIPQLRDPRGGAGKALPEEYIVECPQYVAGEPQSIIRRRRKR